MGIRYYDPITARFVSRDPMLGINDYTYCENNPVGWVDPLGLAVRSPGFWESLIPVWGSGRQAIHRFQTGHPVRGVGNLALAVTDVFLVRSLVTGIAKVGVKGVGKLGALAAGRRVARKALKPLANESGRVLIGKAAVNLHHAWPKYLGGLKNQKLLGLTRELHVKYHKGLDKILPRQRGAKYYRSLSGTKQAELFGKLRKYTEAFDTKHGTRIWDRLTEEASR